MVTKRRLLASHFRPLWFLLGSVVVAAVVTDAFRAPVQRDEIEVREPVTDSLPEKRRGAHEKLKDRNLENRSRPDEPILGQILAKDMEVTGQWRGFKAFWHCSSLIIRRDAAAAGGYRLLFVRETDLGVWHFKRTAKLSNGILTLNKPVREVGFPPTRTSYRVLYAVRTSRGEFLLPSVNAETMDNLNDLTPGFAYQRSERGAADEALEGVSMGSRLDDAIELMEALLPLAVRTKIKTVPLLYELSFGPACWLARINYSCLKPVAVVYEPLVRIALHGKGLQGHSLRAYATALSGSGREMNGLLLMAFALIPDEVLPIRAGRGE